MIIYIIQCISKLMFDTFMMFIFTNTRYFNLLKKRYRHMFSEFNDTYLHKKLKRYLEKIDTTLVLL